MHWSRRRVGVVILAGPDMIDDVTGERHARRGEPAPGEPGHVKRRSYSKSGVLDRLALGARADAAAACLRVNAGMPVGRITLQPLA